MKCIKATLFGTLALGLAINSHAQVYQLSTPISGILTLGITETNGLAGSSTYSILNLSALTETVYLDPAANTIRQVGFIYVTPSETNLSFNDTQDLPAQFPNPPQAVSGVVTVSLNIVGGGISFDTGPQSIVFNSVLQSYTNNAYLTNMTIPINAAYQLQTGGQTYSGTFSYVLYNLGVYAGTPPWMYSPYAFSALSVSNYPASLVLDGLGDPGYGGFYSYRGTYYIAATNSVGIAPGLLVADVTASNGLHIQLLTGSYYDYELFGWSSGPVTANIVTNGSAPSITSQPGSILTNALNSASFSVAASGALPLSYQWALNGTNISAATSSTLTISNVTQSDLGTYVVVVANSFGTNTSAGAVLSMYPFLATPFTGTVAYWGENTTVSVGAWGTGPLSYQWFDGGVAIPGATSSALTFASIQLTNAGLYSVIVSSPLGSVTNAPAQLVVNPAGTSLGLYPGLTIQGVVGYSYVIQATTNLSNTNSWVTLTNLILAQPVQLWVDTNVNASLPANPNRFYQVLPGP